MTDYKFTTDVYRHKVVRVEDRGSKIAELVKYKSIHEASEKTGEDKDFILNCCIWFNSETINNFSKIKKWKFQNNINIK